MPQWSVHDSCSQRSAQQRPSSSLVTYHLTRSVCEVLFFIFNLLNLIEVSSVWGKLLGCHFICIKFVCFCCCLADLSACDKSMVPSLSMSMAMQTVKTGRKGGNEASLAPAWYVSMWRLWFGLALQLFALWISLRLTWVLTSMLLVVYIHGYKSITAVLITRVNFWVVCDENNNFNEYHDQIHGSEGNLTWLYMIGNCRKVNYIWRKRCRKLNYTWRKLYKKLKLATYDRT